MSGHRLIATDGGSDCFACGGHFACSLPLEADAEHTSHECDTSEVETLVPCESTPCVTDENPDGSHVWELTFPWIAGKGPKIVPDDELVATCHFCGTQVPEIEGS